MKIVLRAVARARKLRPVARRPEVPRRRNITIRPARGGMVSLQPRSEILPSTSNGAGQQLPLAVATATADGDK
jgi:hypothetical protein